MELFLMSILAIFCLGVFFLSGLAFGLIGIIWQAAKKFINWLFK